MQCLTWLRWGLVALVVGTLGWGLQAAGAAPAAPSPASQFGINWGGSAEMEPRAERFERAVATGVGWDRWVFYWADMERTPGSIDWSRQDRTFLAEAPSGLSINAVLLTTPDHYARSGLKGQAPPRVGEQRDLLYRLEAKAKGLLPEGPTAPTSCPGPANTTPPASLYEPVFITQGGQSVVNPANHWASFVYQAVQRYKPGGELARANGLPASFGVRAWEIWNEPDWDCSHAGDGFGGFFNGSPADYYQMVKVAYQVVKRADPSAYVVTGGLTYWANPGWFDEFAQAVKADPDKTGQTRNGYYFDAVALHWYSNARNALDQSVAFSQRIQARGLPAKPLWLTETGLPLCCDGVGYAQPDSPFHGSPDDQASYVVQNAAYALWMRRDAPSGTDRVFHFQLYDDGVDGAFGVFGLVRNPPGPGQHPTQPGEPRPGYYALQVVMRYLDGATPVSRTTTGAVERIVFQRPDGTRVTVLWNWNTSDRAVTVRAAGSAATRVDRVGQATALAPVGGNYTLTLPAATNYNTLDGTALIGGAPYLLVEGGASPPVSPTPTRTPNPTATATPPAAPTATPLPAGCVNRVANPGFELTTGWTLEQATRSTFQPYEGRYAAYVGLAAVPRGTTWSAARQSVTLPTSGGRITLSYAQALGAGGTANQQVVEIWANDEIIRTVEDHNPAVNQDWTAKSFDLTDLLRPYLGQTVRLVFAVRNEAGQPGAAFMRVDNVSLAVCAPTTLRGRVADAAGLSIPGATVTLTSGATGPNNALTATADSLGQFSFANLPDGPLTLSASASGYGVWPARAVTGSETVELRLPPAPSAVTNGGFEGSLGGWSLSGSTTPLATAGLSQAGVGLGDQFRPDPGQAWGNSTLSQTVTVGDQDGVGLGFAYRLETAETAAGADFFEVLVIDGGQRTDLLPRYWRASADWAYLWLDLGRWRGRTVTLIFNVYQSTAERPTRVWLDEVSVGATRQLERPYRFWLPHIAVGQ